MKKQTPFCQGPDPEKYYIPKFDKARSRRYIFIIMHELN